MVETSAIYMPTIGDLAYTIVLRGDVKNDSET